MRPKIINKMMEGILWFALLMMLFVGGIFTNVFVVTGKMETLSRPRYIGLFIPSIVIVIIWVVVSFYFITSSIKRVRGNRK